MSKLLFRIALVATAIAGSASTASAAIFDTVTGIAAVGATGPAGFAGSTTLMGASFTAAPGSFSQIDLELSASTPLDGGSATLYLVPDDGSGGATGVAGLPTIEDGSYNFTSFSGAQVIGTILDSSLTTTPALVDFLVTPTITTPNDEYWVVLDALGTTSVLWTYEGGHSGVGTAGQAFFNNAFGSNLAPAADPAYGIYQMEVGVPEPSTLAVMGLGLLGLGWLRRMRHSRA